MATQVAVIRIRIEDSIRCNDKMWWFLQRINSIEFLPTALKRSLPAAERRPRNYPPTPTTAMRMIFRWEKGRQFSLRT